MTKRRPEYGIWATMKSRCQNSKFISYKFYGARGIKVCKQWQKFENFIKDMGPRPSPQHSLDRRDNDKGYEPGNVRWATLLEQHNNRRNKPPDHFQQ